MVLGLILNKYWKTIGIILIIKGTSSFMSNTLLIRFPIILSVYIVYRMHKVERRMVKTNAMNTQGHKIQATYNNVIMSALVKLI